MYMTNLPDKTLGDLATEWDERLMTWGGRTSEIRCNLDVNEQTEVPRIMVGGIEIPATKDGLAALASFLDIPPKFFIRLDPDEQQHLLRTRTHRVDKDVTISYKERGLYDVRTPGETRLRPQRLIEAALTTFPENSQIVEAWNDQNELRVDVLFPDGYERYIGGDPAVGDITRGGLRIGQDRKHNMAPWLQPFLWRRVCTNGMELPDQGLKVEVRGAEEAEIIALFEAEIARAVDRLEADIHAFYDLRSQKLGTDPTGALHRAATEMNIPLRTIGRMEDLVPALLEEAGDNEISMFDVVNLMTNQANDPRLGNRSSGRRALQQAGGVLISDHAERCGTCHSRLSR